MPLYLPAVGGALGSVVYILFVQLESMAVSWLCLASFLAGIFGGVTSVIASCFSYVAALTDKDSRTLRSVASRHTHVTMAMFQFCRVSIVESMNFLAAAVGPFISKAVRDGLGSVYVFAGEGCQYEASPCIHVSRQAACCATWPLSCTASRCRSRPAPWPRPLTRSGSRALLSSHPDT